MQIYLYLSLYIIVLCFLRIIIGKNYQYYFKSKIDIIKLNNIINSLHIIINIF